MAKTTKRIQEAYKKLCKARNHQGAKRLAKLRAARRDRLRAITKQRGNNAAYIVTDDQLRVADLIFQLQDYAEAVRTGDVKAQQRSRMISSKARRLARIAESRGLRSSTSIRYKRAA